MVCGWVQMNPHAPPSLAMPLYVLIYIWILIIYDHTYINYMQYYFKYQPGEVFSCTADIGWITGHSYVVYGPLCNGATTVLFDSTALHPNPCIYMNKIPRGSYLHTFNFFNLYIARYWELVEKLKVNHFYTTPSMIRKLMSLDKDIPSSYDLSSLRVIASGKQKIKSRANGTLSQRLDFFAIQLVNV